MSLGEQQIKRIQEKIQQVLRQHQGLKRENQLLKAELEEIREKAASKDELLEQLKQQVEILKFSNGDMTEEDKKQFQKKITAYLKEIDRCIAMLSR